VQASARSERMASEGVRDESPQGRDHEACEGGTIDDSPPRLAGRRTHAYAYAYTYTYTYTYTYAHSQQLQTQTTFNNQRPIKTHSRAKTDTEKKTINANQDNHDKRLENRGEKTSKADNQARDA